MLVQDGETKEGVFIPRRDTSSWFNQTLGGRVDCALVMRGIAHEWHSRPDLHA